MSVDYAKGRYAFGRPIGSFQAIKHKLADMYIKNELARANCYYGAWALPSGAKELPVAAAGARISATQAYHFASKENIQTHGGIGFTWEHDCHLFYRRSKLLSLVLGSLHSWKDRLITHLEKQAEGTRRPRRPERRRKRGSSHGLQRHPPGSAVPPAGARLARRQCRGPEGLRRQRVRRALAARRSRLRRARARSGRRKKTDAGYGVIQWPKEYGGAGGSTMQAMIYREEEARYEVPAGVFDIGLGMCGPVLMMYADEAHQEAAAARAWRAAQDIWCQLFSEPIAGSDLAGLRTRAERDGDDWVVNGQKVWTSGAHYSRYGILVTRHDRPWPSTRASPSSGST